MGDDADRFIVLFKKYNQMANHNLPPDVQYEMTVIRG